VIDVASEDPMVALVTWAENELKSVGLQLARETTLDLANQRLVSDYNRTLDEGIPWIPVSMGGGYYTAQDTTRPFDEVYLNEIQTLCRYLAMNNAYAAGLLENLESYIVGTGHRYRVIQRSTPIVTLDEGEDGAEEVAIGDAPPASKPGKDSPLKDTVSKVQAFLDEWLYRRRWASKQREIVRRKHRDGESIIRFVEGKDGLLDIRFIEPQQLRSPTGDVKASFGIETDESDVQDVRRYWVVYGDEQNPESVDAAEVQHRKSNVDSNTKRGLPSLWAMASHVRTAVDVLGRMGLTAKIQTSVAILKIHKSSPRSPVEQQVRAAADFRTTSVYTGQDVDVTDFGQGARIYDVSGETEWKFPSDAVNVEAFVALVQAQLRAAAARKGLPEFMLSADASNSNYSSTLIAESPAIRMFEREQADMRDDDLSILWRMLEEAVESNKLSGVDLDQLDILCEFPQLFVREGDKFSATLINERNEGVRSPQNVAASLGLDYEQELRNSIDAEIRENEMREEAGLEPKFRTDVLQPGGPNDPTALPGQGPGRPAVPGNPASPPKPAGFQTPAGQAPRPR
jgi:capsid protein